MKPRSKHPPVIGVDFDGTLCQIFKKNTPYVPKSVIKERPNWDVVDMCRRYRKHGCRIVVYTSRWWGDYHWLKMWLDKHKVPYDDIVPGKFKADAFVDDTTVNPSLDHQWESRLRFILGLQDQKPSSRPKRRKR
jgi:hypothetical protein